MAKKRSANDFNMSRAIHELLTANPKASIGELHEALVAKYPSAKINKNSFSVAFYNGRKKLGIKSGGRRGKSTTKVKAKNRPMMNMHALQTAVIKL